MLNVLFEHIKNNIKSCPDFEGFFESINCKIVGFPWDHYQKMLCNEILRSLNNLKPNSNLPVIPKEGLRGVYFCLGDDGYHFSIAGSLYFDEIDWAANADFYHKDNLDKYVQEIIYNLELLEVNKEGISDLIFAFSAFTLFKAMLTEEAEGIPEISNAAIVLGYSDGDELILGYFKNNKFIQDIQIVNGGEYANASTAVHDFPDDTEPRDVIWRYLHHNYGGFIKQQGLTDQFIQGGEVAAEKICNEFSEHVFINRCHICGSIKKTPQARLCLTCGDFSDVK